MTTPAELAASNRAYVIAAAGCGKTRLIIDAVESDRDRRHLILTHTNAGVEVLRRRLAARGIGDARARVQTVTGFALRYASAYPQRSELPSLRPTGAEWPTVVAGATRVLDTRVGRRILAETYRSVFVDEYQDCSVSQHELVLALAGVLPTRVLGDPMQAIFDFAGDTLIEWSDVDQHFERLPDLTRPHRWAMTNPALGEWLSQARDVLAAGGRLTYSSPVRVIRVPDGNAGFVVTANACRSLGTTQSAVLIHRWPDGAHKQAERLGGMFTSMEELECRDLDRAARRLGKCDGVAFAAEVVDFATTCFTGIKTPLSTVRKHLAKRALPPPPRPGKTQAAVMAIRAAGETATPASAAAALDAIGALDSARLIRAELYEEMQRTLREAAAHPELPLHEVAWQIRDRTRRYGRRVQPRVVSRTLLIKGLEFDHALVLDATDLADSPKDLYVALTRPRHSLTVLLR